MQQRLPLFYSKEETFLPLNLRQTSVLYSSDNRIIKAMLPVLQRGTFLAPLRNINHILQHRISKTFTVIRRLNKHTAILHLRSIKGRVILSILNLFIRLLSMVGNHSINSSSHNRSISRPILTRQDVISLAQVLYLNTVYQLCHFSLHQLRIIT